MNEPLAASLAHSALEYLQAHYPKTWAKAHRTSPKTFHHMKARRFLAEYCQVVYASGFRAKVLQTKFPALRQAFRNFDPKALVRMDSIEPVLKVFRHERKARCFLAGAKAIAEEGFGAFKRRLRREGLDVLEELPGLGPITKFHLAKNIGLADLPKPDIWLERAAKLCEAENVFELVAYMAEVTGQPQRVIDTALWRYAVDGGVPRLGRK
jgi:hypothetical protein